MASTDDQNQPTDTGVANTRLGLGRCARCRKWKVDAAFVRSSVKRGSAKFNDAGFQFTRYKCCNACAGKSTRSKPGGFREEEFVRLYGAGYHDDSEPEDEEAFDAELKAAREQQQDKA